MKTFEDIYQEITNSDNSEIKEAHEKAKIKQNKYRTIGIIIGLIINILVLLSIINNFGFHSIIFMLVIDLFIYIITNLAISMSKEQRKYLDLYKNKIIKKIIENFYTNLEYFPYKEIPEYIYKTGNYEYYEKYTSDDYFEALIDEKNSIQMAEVLTEEEREYKDSEGNIRKEVITKFHGLFAKVELEKSINSELRITKNQTGLFNRDKVKMDSVEFEKNFDVKSTNKIIAMQILTSDIMLELVEFLKLNKIKYDIYINNNELFIRFHCGAMFEVGKMKKGIMDKELVQRYYQILKFTYNVARKLIKTINEVEI